MITSYTYQLTNQVIQWLTEDMDVIEGILVDNFILYDPAPSTSVEEFAQTLGDIDEDTLKALYTIEACCQSKPSYGLIRERYLTGWSSKQTFTFTSDEEEVKQAIEQ